MPDRVTGRDIILGILENMQEGLEPLLYTTLAPGLYEVYLHVDDYALVDEGRRNRRHQSTAAHRRSFE